MTTSKTSNPKVRKVELLELRKTKSANKKFAWIYSVINPDGAVLYERRSNLDYCAAVITAGKVAFLKDMGLPRIYTGSTCDAVALTFEFLKRSKL